MSSLLDPIQIREGLDPSVKSLIGFEPFQNVYCVRLEYIEGVRFGPFQNVWCARHVEIVVSFWFGPSKMSG